MGSTSICMTLFCASPNQEFASPITDKLLEEKNVKDRCEKLLQDCNAGVLINLKEYTPSVSTYSIHQLKPHFFTNL